MEGKGESFYQRSPVIEILVFGVLIIVSYILFYLVSNSSNKINFIGILGSIATILGFYLTLYQLKKLRSIAEASFEVKLEVNKQRFLFNAEKSIEKYLESLNGVGTLFLKATQFDPDFIHQNILTLNSVLDGIKGFNVEQNKAKYLNEFDCTDCISSLDRTIGELLKDLQTTTELELAKKFTYWNDINKIKDRFLIIKSNLSHEREFK